MTFEVKLPDTPPQKIDIGYRATGLKVARSGHLPPQVVRFEHEILPSGPHVIWFNTFMMPVRAELEKAFIDIADKKSTWSHH